MLMLAQRKENFMSQSMEKDVFTLLASVMVMPAFKYLWRYSFICRKIIKEGIETSFSQ